MKQYESYKDSGYITTGRIPNHWIINKFGRVSYMKGRIGWQGLKQSEFSDDPNLPYLITGMNFKDGKIRWDEVYHISEERYNEAPEIQLQEYDIIMTKDGTIGKLLFVDYLPNRASLNSHLLVLRPFNGSYYPRYIYYQLQTDHFKQHVEQTKVGTTFFGITQEATGEYKVLLPPIKEQEYISQYLDHKTSLIDDLIAKKQKKIELLKENRTALINHAVTKGLNPNVEMRDSGVEWIGEIPIQWKSIPLKYCVKILRGKFTHRPRNDERYYGGDYAFIQTGDIVKSGKYITTYTQTLNDLGYSVSMEFPINTVVMSIAANIGDVSILKIRSCFPDSIVGFFPSSTIHYEYLYFMFQSLKQELLKQSTISTQLNINIERIGSIKIVIPPLVEQDLIINYLNEQTKLIDSNIEKEQQKTDFLKEYRQSLISEVVTGKIDVRKN